MAHPFIPVNNAARFELIYTVESQRIENTLWIHRKTTAWTAANLATMAGRLVTWWTASYAPRTFDGLQFEKIVATDFTSQTTPRIEYVSGLPLLGTDANDPCPNNVTVAISLRTALRGRSYRGRVYHCGMTVAMVAGSKLAAGWNALLAACYNALLTAVNDTDHELVVCSQFNNHAWRGAGVVTPIIAISIDDNLDSQRRRLVQRGI
jgi:hypothetical protein